MSQDKNKRQIEVYKAITKLKTGYIDDVMSVVAPVVGETSDNAALKRAVRRDLNALVDSHVLAIEYYTPSGELIPPDEEDQHKNTRAKYFIPGEGDLPIKGRMALEKSGYAVICKESLVPALNFIDNFNLVPKGANCLSFDNGQGSYVHFWVLGEDLPLKVQFSRGFEYAQEFVLRKKIKESLGRRSLLILGSNRSVSRYKINEFISHVQFNLGPSPTEMEVIKTNMESQVSFAKKWDMNSTTDLLTQGDETREIPKMDFEFSPIKDSVSLKIPNMIRVGQTLVFCHLKK